jgi:gliding motility-associated-like protein
MKTYTIPKYLILLLFALLLFNAPLLVAQTVINLTVSAGERPLLQGASAIDCFAPTDYLNPGIDNKSKYFETTLSGTGTFSVTKDCGVDNIRWDIIVNPPAPPDIYNMTGGGSFCDNGVGLPVGLDGSDSGINYQLMRDGINVGAAVPGTGSPLNFGNQAIGGSYTVLATNVAYPAQQSTMNGSATIIVYPLPTISIPGDYALCAGTETTLLATGTGDTYTWNNAVTNGVPFTPLSTNTYGVTATITSSGCQTTGQVIITVNPLPIVNFTGLVQVVPGQCNTSPINSLVGSQAGGIFTGPGIASTGAGTANFDPSTSGLGIHSITYTYTDANSCSNSQTQQTRVGTEIFMNGLDPVYCTSDAPITFNYTPFLPFHVDTKIYTNGLAGSLTDLGGGEAVFDPLAAGPTTDIITYEFWDEIGCVNIISQPVEVAATPSANFSGLNASLEYCKGAADVTLTGNYAPLGTFSGPVGALVDNGDGTATFSPAALPVGGPYTITYTYTNTSNCSDTESKDVTILIAPTATLSGSAAICAGTSTDLTVTLTGTPDFNITYTDGLSIFNANNITSPHTIPVSPPTSRTYTITKVTHATNACTATGTGSATITVTPQVQVVSDPVDYEVCENGSAVFTVEATGTADLQYEWFYKGLSQGVGSNNVLSVNNVPLGDNGSQVYCVVSSTTCGNTAISASATLTVRRTTAVTTQPADAVKCEGSGHTFTVAAVGHSLSYQWQKFDGALWQPLSNVVGQVSGVTSQSLNLLNLDLSEAGDYRCVVSGFCTSDVSNTATLEVHEAIDILIQPVGQTACKLTDVQFTVATNLPIDHSYEWFFRQGAAAFASIGDVNPTLVLDDITTADSGQYYCEITSPCGEVQQSNTVRLRLYQDVVITKQPTSKQRCEGSTVYFTIEATGAVTGYQWYYNAAPIAGETSASLELTGVTQLADGGNYYCMALGQCGDVPSATATLTVDQNYLLSTQPQSKLVCDASGTSLSVGVDNNSNQSYEWFFNLNTTGTFVSQGVGTGTYNIPSFDAATHAGSYYAVVGNACQTYTSATAVLTGADDVVLTSASLVTLSECAGEDVEFPVTATGTIDSIRWFKNGVRLFDNASIFDTQTPGLDILNITPADNGSYVCEVYGRCNQIFATYNLTVSSPVQLTSSPVNDTVCEGLPASLSFTHTGTGPFTYTWKRQDGAAITGAAINLQSLDFAATDLSNEGNYYCEVSNACTTVPVLTGMAYLTVEPNFSISSQPANLTRCVGTTAQFSVVASEPGFSYQWQKGGADLNPVAPYSGVNTPNLSISNIGTADAGQYRCVVTGYCGSQLSSPATLTVNPIMTITQQPVGDTVCDGDEVTLLVAATGSPLMEWYHNGAPTGIFGAVLTRNPYVAGTHNGSYHSVLTNACGTISSDTVELTDGVATTINTQPTAKTRCVESAVSFAVSASGSNLTYQWRREGVPLSDNGRIVGANQATLAINSVTLSDYGHYTCVVSGTCGPVTSTGALLTVVDSIRISSEPISDTLCSGGDATLTVQVSSGNPAYNWIALSGGLPAVTNLSSLSLTNVTASGDYYCEMTNYCGTVNSNTAHIEVEPNLVVNNQPVPVTDCEGENISFTFDVSGPMSLSYQWFKGSNPLSNLAGKIAGAQAATLSINNLVESDQGSYFCKVLSTCGTVDSDVAALTVDENLNITIEPVATSALIGNSAGFTVSVEGTNPLYQWYGLAQGALANVGAFSGTTTANLQINPVAASHEDEYYCIITGTCNVLTSASVGLTVLASSVISTQPVASLSKCTGENLSLSVVTSGSGHSYQWYRGATLLVNDGRIQNATTANLSISNLSPTDQGNYTCVINGGAETSSASQVIVYPATLITASPQDAVKCAGDLLTFEVSATGGGVLAYQWAYNGVNIPGATSDTYQILAVADADDGLYLCKVKGACGDTVLSQPAQLVVNDTTHISIHPADAAVCENQSVNMQVTASGDSLSYQWYYSGTTAVPGADKALFTLNNAQLTDDGFYRVEVQGACDLSPKASNFAYLTVNPAVQLTKQPLSKTRCDGEDVSFSVIADGTGLSYQWYFNATNLLTGQTNETLSLSGLTKAHEGSYTCRVSGSCGTTVISNQAVLTVNEAIGITLEPLTHTLCENSSTTLEVTATGDVLAYQWYYNNQALADTGSFSGTDGPVLSIDNARLGDAGAYRVALSGACNNEVVYSSYAQVSVDTAVAIEIQPLAAEVCEGTTVELSVQARGTGLTYQWMHEGTDIFGENAASIVLSNVTVANQGNYRVRLNGTCGTNILSAQALLTVHPKVVISQQPMDSTVCENGNASLEVLATGVLSYQWKRAAGNLSLSDGAKYSGTTSAKLQVYQASPADAGGYYAMLSGGCQAAGGTATSAAGTLTVHPATAITVHPQGDSLCAGQSYSLWVEAVGDALTYEWFFNTIPIGGATGPSYTLNNLQAAQSGSYTCKVTGTCGEELSAPAVLTVLPATVITEQPFSQTVCEDNQVVFSVEALGPNLNYQWIKNNTTPLTDDGNLTGSRSKDLSIQLSEKAHEGYYTCVVSGTCGYTESNTVELTLLDSTVITSQPSAQTIVEGGTAFFGVSATDSILSYQWQRDGVNLVDNGTSILGATTAYLTLSTVQKAQEGLYSCVVTGFCGVRTSNAASLSVQVPVLIVSEPSDTSLCEGESVQFEVEATGAGLSYQWYFGTQPISDGLNVSGTRGPVLILGSLSLANQGNYTCEVSGDYGVERPDVYLDIKELTRIQSHPADTAVCEHQNPYFGITAMGETLSYLWYKDNNVLAAAGNLSGLNDDLLVISDAGAIDAGVYRCLVSGACNNLWSNPASLSVNLLPITPGAISGDNQVCQGETSVLYVVPAIANATSYVWTLPYGASILSGQGTRSILVNYSKNALSGSVSVHGLNACGEGPESNLFDVTVNATPVANAGVDQLVCGETTTLSANTVAGTWTRVSGNVLISDPTVYNTQLTKMEQGENTLVWTVSSNGCIARDTVKITNTQVTVDAGEDQYLCSDSTHFAALTPLTGGVWTVIQGGGSVVEAMKPNSLVRGLYQDENIFAWMVNNQGCVSGDTVSLFNYLPKVPSAGVDQINESDYSVMDAKVPEAGTIGTWSLQSGSGIFVEPNNPKSEVISLGPGTNTFRWSVQRQNCILYDEMTIENTLIEDPEAGLDQFICVDYTRMAASVPAVGVGEWSVMSGAATFEDKYDNETRVTGLAPGENWLRWSVSTSYQTIVYDSVLIHNKQSTVANAGLDVTICYDSIQLSGNTALIGTGKWVLNSGSGTILNETSESTWFKNIGQGKNYLKWVINNDFCFSEDVVIITNNTPTEANAGIDQTICSDYTTLVPNTPSIGTASWSRIAGAGTFDGNTVTQLAPDTNILRYTITKGSCKSTDDVVIVNHMPTIPDAGYEQRLCADSVKLAGNTALQGTGVWTIQSGSGDFSALNVPNPLVSNISDGLNIYRWTITKQGCELFDEVLVYNDFVQSFAGNDVVLCKNNTQLLASNPSPGTGTWEIVGSSGAVFQNQQSPNTLVSNLSKGDNQLRWTVTNQNCVSTDDVVITNYQPTDALAGENQSLCGKEAQLNANVPAYGDGMWILMAGSGVFDDPTNPKTTVRNLAEGQNTLRWTISMDQCLSFDDVVLISNMADNVFAGNDQIACSDTAVLAASTPAIGKGFWTIIRGSGNFDNANSPTSVIRNLGKGDNVLKWTVTSSDCHVIDTVVITSSIPTRSVAGADQILCKNSTLMAGNTPSVGTGEWLLVSGSVVIEEPANPNSPVTGIALGSSTLRWMITENGCQSYSDITLINNQPSNPFAGYDTDVCGDSVRLFAEPPTVGTGRWTLVSGDAVIAIADTNQTPVSKIKFGDNTFRWTVTHMNCVMTDDVVITNNYEFVNAGDNRTVNTANVQLIGNVPTRGTGRWEVSASPAILATPDNFETMANGLGSGANKFVWTITNDDCIASDDVVINYVVMPIADFQPTPMSGCPPLSVNFVNTSIGGAPYSWDFGDGNTSNEPHYIHTYTEPGTYRAVLTATAPLGGTVTKDTLIVVYENPIAKFSISPDSVYIPDEHISCFNYSIRMESSVWDFGDGSIISGYAPTYNYEEEGTYDIELKVYSKQGCADSLTIPNAVYAIKRSDFIFPDAFTPNPFGSSDGAYNMEDRSNDVFYPIMLNGDLDEYEMFIYNRQGVQVFKSDRIEVGWDGYYRGRLLPQDVYVYMVRGKYNSGKPFQRTGNVLLIVKDH